MKDRITRNVADLQRRIVELKLKKDAIDADLREALAVYRESVSLFVRLKNAIANIVAVIK